MSSLPSLPQRVVELESIVTHLQRDFEQLNDVVLELHSKLESVSQQMLRFETRLGRLLDDDESQNG